MFGAGRSLFRRALLLLPMFVTWQLIVQSFLFAKTKTGAVLTHLSWDVFVCVPLSFSSFCAGSLGSLWSKCRKDFNDFPDLVRLFCCTLDLQLNLYFFFNSTASHKTFFKILERLIV